jgi:hypothetical protein
LIVACPRGRVARMVARPPRRPPIPRELLDALLPPAPPTPTPVTLRITVTVSLGEPELCPAPPAEPRN